MGKKITFKQRQKLNSMKAKQGINNSIRKQAGGRSRLGNRHDFDPAILSQRTISELVDDVSGGSAIAARDNLDARALADLLARPIEKLGGKKQLLAAPLPESDPAALPEVPAVPEDEQFFRDQANRQGDDAANKNRYKKKGAPFAYWEGAGLHPRLLEALKDLKFSHPTPIQEESVAFAIKESAKTDIVVSAETGSGKTLVFALPILNSILNTRPETAKPPTWREVGGKTKRAASDVGKRGGAAAAGAEDDGDEDSDESDEDEEHGLATSGAAADAAARGAATAAEAKRRAGRVMHSLIISPTRELALQIAEMFKQLTRHCSVTIGCVVGGMAPAKQQRVLNRHPDVLICTPGRIWELVQKNEGCYLGHSISRRLAVVVLDEADKLLQSGRFEELKKILERVHSEYLPAGEQEPTLEGDVPPPGEEGEEGEGKDGGLEVLCEGVWDEKLKRFIPKAKLATAPTAAAAAAAAAAAPKVKRLQKDDPRPVPMPPAPGKKHRVVTFVTSATLSLQTNYERTDIKKKQIIRTKNSNTMRSVLHELGIKQKQCKIFNQSPESGVVAKINETFLRCPEDSKDLYLYYFLRQHKERAIVFVNAISMLRRLTKLLDILGIAVVGLHASMQQRQRLKFIDRFKASQKQVLVATDIASRGLDIEGLKHVIHYQVPRSTDAYIHRCGRTARCGGTGLSVMLVNASEYVSFKKLSASLGRKTPMETFAVDPTSVHRLHPHVKLAFEIDQLQKVIDKKAANQRWIQRTGDQIEIDADDMIDPEAEQEARVKRKQIAALKKQLEIMVKKDVNVGGRGAYRTAAKQLGELQAVEKLKERALRQTNQQDPASAKKKGRGGGSGGRGGRGGGRGRGDGAKRARFEKHAAADTQ